MGASAAILKLGSAIFDGLDVTIRLAHGKDQWVGGAGIDNIVASRRGIAESTKNTGRENGDRQGEQTDQGSDRHLGIQTRIDTQGEAKKRGQGETCFGLDRSNILSSDDHGHQAYK